MKHLREYKLFESKDLSKIKRGLQSEAEDLVSILKDLALDIKDKDLNVEVTKRSTDLKEWSIGNFGYYIHMIIDKYDRYSIIRFNLYEIKDEIMEIVDFMDSQGWVIDGADVLDASGPHNVLIRDNMIISQYSGEEVNYLISEIHIRFKKSKTK